MTLTSGTSSANPTPMQLLANQQIANNMSEAQRFSEDIAKVFNLGGGTDNGNKQPVAANSGNAFDSAWAQIFNIKMPAQQTNGQPTNFSFDNDDYYSMLGLGFKASNAAPWDPSKLNINLGDVKYDAAAGEKLANAGIDSASTKRTKGYCFRGVKDAFNGADINNSTLKGGSAYMAASQLADNPKFKEISVNRQDLDNLPKGAIVVWGRSSEKPHGHVSIALGNGKEASDHIQDQIQNGYSFGGYRVFLPVTSA